MGIVIPFRCRPRRGPVDWPVAAFWAVCLLGSLLVWASVIRLAVGLLS